MGIGDNGIKESRAKSGEQRAESGERALSIQHSVLSTHQ
jgi:hypothetical protein